MTDFAEYGRPRRVAGGLRARSARGPIGRSWWSRRFLDVLESFALGTRLTRGRAYARAGQVISLDVTPGRVIAAVQGSRPKPYRVTIGLRPFGEPSWARIETQLAQQARYSARLLAGDLPPDLEQVFADAGVPLFPTTVDELDLTCDCPDFAVPCKHLAATFYLLAEAFDADPFQILHWRGRDREQLLVRLRALRAGPADRSEAASGAARPATRSAAAPTAAPATETPVAGAALVLSELPDAPLAADRFWLPPVPLPARATTPPTDPELLLRQLGAPPAAIGGPGLTERLRPAYARFADPPAPAATGSQPSVEGR